MGLKFFNYRKCVCVFESHPYDLWVLIQEYGTFLKPSFANPETAIVDGQAVVSELTQNRNLLKY